MQLEKEILQGRLVTLEPLGTALLSELNNAASDASIWEWFPFQLNDPDVMELFVSTVERFPETGEGLPYAIRLNESNGVIGGTGLWNIDHRHCKAEIGVTWLMPRHQRSGSNTEAKYLLLNHAFNKLCCRRISFSVHSRNIKSQNAVARIGATREGVLRHDQIHRDGSARDSVIFSIIKSEWPAVKDRLESMMGNRPG